MEGNYSPVVLFVYNRPQHTYNLLNCIDNLDEAQHTELYVFSDGPKVKADDNIVKVREIIKEFAANNHFRKVHICESQTNKGLATSIIEGVTQVINKYGRAIVLEDDLEVSSDFLAYMNAALDAYKDNESIWAISAYTFPMKAFKDYKHDVYVSGRGCSWGWATWKDRWNTVDWKVNRYNEYKYNIVNRSRFASWGRDLPCMLDAYMYNEIHSWAIRWCFAAHLQNKYTIYPVCSRILNKGTDGSGTNYNKAKTTTFDTELSVGNTCYFENVLVDRKIQREFSRKYLPLIEYVKVNIRWFLIKIRLLHAHVK